MGNEHQWISSGQKNRVIQSHGLLFMPQICYDLRFPVWHRNQVENGRFKYDVLTFHANWPEVRIQAWRMLLIARAIENQAYVVGINRCGVDGNGIFHSGESMVVGPQGNILAEASRGKESILHFTMYHDDLISWRNNFQVSNDWDDFKITD
jgi:predicted amidohydrolase